MSDTGTTYGTGKLSKLGHGYSHVRLARCRGGLRLTFRKDGEHHEIKVPMDRDDQVRVFAAGREALGVLAVIAHDKRSEVEHTIETRRTYRFRVSVEAGSADALMAVAVQEGVAE